MTNTIVENAVENDAIHAIKQIVVEQVGLNADALALDTDLYAAGLSSLATVGLMLALEDRLDVEFPESMLGRATFRSVRAIAEAVSKLSR